MASTSAFLIDATDINLVSDLIKAQLPQYRDLRVTYAATGWDNVMFRLGADLAVRLPRRLQALEPQANEIRWLNQVTEPLSVGHPAIQHVGAPSAEFPHPWTVVNWMEGIRSMTFPPAQRTACAERLGTELARLHRTAPSDAPINPFRGTPLHERNHVISARLDQVPLLGELRDIWEEAVKAPDFPAARVWCHGDIHPGNYVLNSDCSLAGIIDFGDVTQGDPAVDLGTAWASFDPTGRALFMEAYLENCAPEISADPALVTRAKGWVVATTISAVLASDLSTPDFTEMALWAKKQLLGK